MKTLYIFIFLFIGFGSMAQIHTIYTKYDSTAIKKMNDAYHEAAFNRNIEARANFMLSLDSIASDSAFVFDIRGLFFREMPDIRRFTNIIEINAERNQLTKFRIKSRNLKHIKTINISGNNISDLKIGKAPKLEKIDFGRNPISKIPFGIFRSRKIDELSLNSCNVKKLPWWLPFKKKIRQLYVYNNPLAISNKNIRRMRNLTHLQMSILPGDSISSYFSRLTNLKKLVFYKSKINSLPDNFWQLNNLEVFILYDNEFDEIPEVCFKLPRLHHLDFYYNNVKYIPMGIMQCDSLEELYLSYNQISVIPDALKEMKNLKKLYIHHNNIEEVPKWINSMPQLEVLDMGYNQINELPSFSNLINLHTVDFQSNELTEFPFEWYNLPSLNRIFLFDNPWKLTSKEYKKVMEMKELLKQQGGELFVN